MSLIRDFRFDRTPHEIAKRHRIRVIAAESISRSCGLVNRLPKKRKTFSGVFNLIADSRCMRLNEARHFYRKITIITLPTIIPLLEVYAYIHMISI